MKTVYKKFEVCASKKCSDGTIIVAKFTTGLEESGADPEELFEAAFASTLADVKRKMNSDPIVKEIFGEVKRSIAKEKKMRKSQKSFENE